MRQPQLATISDAAIEDSSPCNALLIAAERELMALAGAVSELFGPDEARLSAEDWIRELKSNPGLPGPAERDRRRITVAALAQLGRRRTARQTSTPSLTEIGRLFGASYRTRISRPSIPEPEGPPAESKL